MHRACPAHTLQKKPRSPSDSAQFGQLKRGRRRFYIIPFSLLESTIQLGFAFYAEDEDAIVVELHYDTDCATQLTQR